MNASGFVGSSSRDWGTPGRLVLLCASLLVLLCTSNPIIPTDCFYKYATIEQQMCNKAHSNMHSHNVYVLTCVPLHICTYTFARTQQVCKDRHTHKRTRTLHTHIRTRTLHTHMHTLYLYTCAGHQACKPCEPHARALQHAPQQMDEGAQRKGPQAELQVIKMHGNQDNKDARQTG